MTPFSLLNAAICAMENPVSAPNPAVKSNPDSGNARSGASFSQDTLPVPTIVLRQDAGEHRCLTCTTCQTHEWQLVDDGTQAEWLCRCVVCGADNEQVEGGGLL